LLTVRLGDSPGKNLKCYNTTDSLFKKYLENVMRVYVAGSDMNERKLGVINKSAATVYNLVKTIETITKNNIGTNSRQPIQNSSVNTTPMNGSASTKNANWKGKSIGILVENEKSSKIINYTLKTNTRDSPTKRLIQMKKQRFSCDSNNNSNAFENSSPRVARTPANNKTRSNKPSPERSRTANSGLSHNYSSVGQKSNKYSEYKYSDNSRRNASPKRPSSAYFNNTPSCLSKKKSTSTKFTDIAKELGQNKGDIKKDSKMVLGSRGKFGN